MRGPCVITVHVDANSLWRDVSYVLISLERHSVHRQSNSEQLLGTWQSDRRLKYVVGSAQRRSHPMPTSSSGIHQRHQPTSLILSILRSAE